MLNKRDNRDPSAIGEKLLGSAKQVRSAYATPMKPIPLSEVWDHHTSKFILPEYVDCVNSLERYGDPTDTLCRCTQKSESGEARQQDRQRDHLP